MFPFLVRFCEFLDFLELACRCEVYKRNVFGLRFFYLKRRSTFLKSRKDFGIQGGFRNIRELDFESIHNSEFNCFWFLEERVEFESKMFRAVHITLVFLFLNIVLFAVKLVMGLLFGSLAMLSDAFNSLVDIATSVMVYFAVKVGSQPPDSGHPFGHARAEPLAAFTVSVLTFVLAFEVIREAVARIFSEVQPEISLIPIFVLFGVIAMKGGMFFVSRKFKKNPALMALAADSKMDVVISLLALVGVTGINFGYPMLDIYAALGIAGWIAWIGFTIARENLVKLMGHCPDELTLRKIRKKLNELKKVGKILSFHELRVQFIGSEIQVAVHVEISKNLKLEEAHTREKEVQNEIKKVEGVAEVAVHVDPT